VTLYAGVHHQKRYSQNAHHSTTEARCLFHVTCYRCHGSGLQLPYELPLALIWC
jgi:hypothetical protein